HKQQDEPCGGFSKGMVLCDVQHSQLDEQCEDCTLEGFAQPADQPGCSTYPTLFGQMGATKVAAATASIPVKTPAATTASTPAVAKPAAVNMPTRVMTRRTFPTTFLEIRWKGKYRRERINPYPRRR
ncbi:hypothetical protein BaRGS_00035448, partial [Batillaria attramentaria]